MELYHIKNALKDAGLKSTQQRIVIYDALVKSKNHPSAEKIYEELKTNNPSLSLGTVYKTLDTFVENNLAKKVMANDGYLRYDGTVSQHNHIYCADTNEIIDYNDPELIKIVWEYLTKKQINNFKITDVSVSINGEKVDKTSNIQIL